MVNLGIETFPQNCKVLSGCEMFIYSMIMLHTARASLLMHIDFRTIALLGCWKYFLVNFRTFRANWKCLWLIISSRKGISFVEIQETENATKRNYNNQNIRNWILSTLNVITWYWINKFSLFVCFNEYFDTFIVNLEW